jgi:hypothetical protein
MLSSVPHNQVRTRNIEDVLLLQEEGHLRTASSDTMGASTRSKTAKPSAEKLGWKFPSALDIDTADEKNDQDSVTRRSKQGWQSPHFGVEDGYQGEKTSLNGTQSRHRKTGDHTRKVSISSGYAGLGSGRRADAVSLADLDASSATETEEDGNGVKDRKKFEIVDRRSDVSGGLTGKDRNAFILLVVLCGSLIHLICNARAYPGPFLPP